MKINVILHGCPQGHRVSGDSADQMYFQQFYSRVSNIQQEFCCEFNQSSKLVYYTLLVNNTIEESNRQGGYFGMTLSLDCYYNNLQYIHSLFQIAFKKFVLGKVVTSVGGTYKFLIQDFSQAKEIISEIAKFFVEQFKLAMLPGELSDISNWSRSGAVVSFNWSDCSQNVMLQNMQKVGKMFISNEYESQDVLSLNQQLAGLNGEKLKLESDKNRLLLDVAKYKKEKQQAEESAKRQIAAKEQEVKQKDATFKKQLEEAGFQRELRDVAASLKEPLETLTGLLEKVAPQEPETEEHETTRFGKVFDSIMKILPVILLCVVIGIQTMGSSKDNASLTEVKGLRAKNADLNNYVTDLQYKLLSYENLILNGAKINISGGSSLKRNQQNTVQIQSECSQLIQGGCWECTECAITCAPSDPLRATIIPKVGDSVTVVFRLGASKIDRTIPIK